MYENDKTKRYKYVIQLVGIEQTMKRNKMKKRKKERRKKTVKREDWRRRRVKLAVTKYVVHYTSVIT